MTPEVSSNSDKMADDCFFSSFSTSFKRLGEGTLDRIPRSVNMSCKRVLESLFSDCLRGSEERESGSSVT